MCKHGSTPSRPDMFMTLAAISPPDVARGRFVGGHHSGLAGCKSPPLFKRRATSCSSQRQRKREPWGASPRPSAPTYLRTSQGAAAAAPTRHATSPGTPPAPGTGPAPAPGSSLETAQAAPEGTAGAKYRAHTKPSRTHVTPQKPYPSSRMGVCRLPPPGHAIAGAPPGDGAIWMGQTHHCLTKCVQACKLCTQDSIAHGSPRQIER